MLKYLIGRLALLCAFACLAPTVALSQEPAPPPNIVFFLIDDLDAALLRQMPRLRTLLTEQGVSFADHFVSISACCPSRSATLRGQFAVHTGIYGNEAPYGGFELFHQNGLEDSTVATWLQAAGYRTALIGKYLNGYPTGGPSLTYIPPGWSEWYSPIGGNPYASFNYTLNQNGTAMVYGAGDTDHITDVISRLSVDFLTRAATTTPTQPFFLYIAPYAPHSPAVPPARYATEFADVSAPRTPSFNEEDLSDKPGWVRKLPLLSDKKIESIDRLYRQRLRSMLGVEDLVQTVLDTLQAQGQLANTYIFFTSDNGFHMGEHRLVPGKGSAFEEDLIVPLIVRGPGAEPGRVVQELSANVDYASTFAEIAGVQPPDFVDGRSLMPLVRGDSVPAWRQALLLEFKKALATQARAGTKRPVDGTLEAPDEVGVIVPAKDNKTPAFRGLRTQDGLTFVQYKSKEFELYDNVSDPFQLTNAYANAPASQKSSLADWARRLQGSAGQALRSIEETRPVGAAR